MKSSLLWRHKMMVWVLSAFLGFGGAGYGSAVFAHHTLVNDGQARHEQVLESNNMWRIVAGTGQINGLDPSDTLALDLKARIGPIDGGELPVEITDFVAGPAKYARVSEYLGFNPFDDADGACHECGHLTEEMLTDLTLIKQGEVSTLIQDETPPTPVGWSLTGLPFWLEAILVWQLLGTAGMLVALRLLSDARMTWQIGDGNYDAQQIMCVIGAPAFMLFYLGLYNHKKLEQIAKEHMQRMADKGYLAAAIKLGQAIKGLTERVVLSYEERTQLDDYRAMLDTLNQAGDEEDFRQEDRHLRRAMPYDAAHDDLLAEAKQAMELRRKNVEEVEQIPQADF